MFPQQTDLTFGLFDLAASTSDAAPLRAAYVWMQNNIGGVVLAPKNPGADVLEYDWPTHSVTNFNYLGVRLRYYDTQYTGAAGESGITSVDGTIEGITVAKWAKTADNKLPTPAVGGEQFGTLTTGATRIVWRYQHPQDATKVVTGILNITVS